MNAGAGQIHGIFPGWAQSPQLRDLHELIIRGIFAASDERVQAVVQDVLNGDGFANQWALNTSPEDQEDLFAHFFMFQSDLGFERYLQHVYPLGTQPGQRLVEVWNGVSPVFHGPLLASLMTACTSATVAARLLGLGNGAYRSALQDGQQHRATGLAMTCASCISAMLRELTQDPGNMETQEAIREALRTVAPDLLGVAATMYALGADEPRPALQTFLRDNFPEERRAEEDSTGFLVGLILLDSSPESVRALMRGFGYTGDSEEARGKREQLLMRCSLCDSQALWKAFAPLMDPEEFAAAWNRLDPSVRGRALCTGYDLDDLAELDSWYAALRPDQVNVILNTPMMLSDAEGESQPICESLSQFAQRYAAMETGEERSLLSGFVRGLPPGALALLFYAHGQQDAFARFAHGLSPAQGLAILAMANDEALRQPLVQTLAMRLGDEALLAALRALHQQHRLENYVQGLQALLEPHVSNAKRSLTKLEELLGMDSELECAELEPHIDVLQQYVSCRWNWRPVGMYLKELGLHQECVDLIDGASAFLRKLMDPEGVYSRAYARVHQMDTKSDEEEIDWTAFPYNIPISSAQLLAEALGQSDHANPWKLFRSVGLVEAKDLLRLGINNLDRYLLQIHLLDAWQALEENSLTGLPDDTNLFNLADYAGIGGAPSNPKKPKY